MIDGVQSLTTKTVRALLIKSAQRSPHRDVFVFLNEQISVAIAKLRKKHDMVSIFALAIAEDAPLRLAIVLLAQCALQHEFDLIEERFDSAISYKLRCSASLVRMMPLPFHCRVQMVDGTVCSMRFMALRQTFEETDMPALMDFFRSQSMIVLRLLEVPERVPFGADQSSIPASMASGMICGNTVVKNVAACFGVDGGGMTFGGTNESVG